MPECPNCKYVADPYDFSPDEGACPNCGSDFYARQPSPLKSEMTERNMPAPGEEDMGGNPLQEGILSQPDGGWQNRMKRDESFASVKIGRGEIPDCPDHDRPMEWNDHIPVPSGGHGAFSCPDEGCARCAAPSATEKPEKAPEEGQLQFDLHTGAWYDEEPHGDCAQCGYSGTHWYRRKDFKDGDPNDETRICSNCGAEEDDPLAQQFAMPTVEHPLGPQTGSLRQTPHLPWYLAEMSDVPMSVIDTEVAPPGPHTVEVPSSSGSSDNLGVLQDLGVQVNGDHPHTWPQDDGQSVMLSHDDPDVLDQAKQIVETHQAGLWGDVVQPALNTVQPGMGSGVPTARPQWAEDAGKAIGLPTDQQFSQHPWASAGQSALSLGLLGAGGLAGGLAKGAGEAGFASKFLSKIPGLGGKAEEATSGLGGDFADVAQSGGRMKGFLKGLPSKGLQYAGIHALLGGGGAGGGGMAAGGGQAPDRPYQMLTHVAGEDSFNHPSTHEEIPKAEDGDTKQKNDGEGYYGNPDVNDIGGTTTGQPEVEIRTNVLHPFDPDGPVGGEFDRLLPKLIDYFFSDQSGDEDPELKQLFGLMSQEVPGWDQGEEPDGAPEGYDPMEQTPNDEPKASAFNPTCPNCGSTLDPSDLQCPQCHGAGHPEAFMNNMVQQSTFDPTDHVNYVEQPDIPPEMTVNEWTRDGRPGPCNRCMGTGEEDPETRALCSWCRGSGIDESRHMKTAADTQGPHTPEQFKAVSEFLITNGRTDEIPHMFEAPWEYADILAQVIGRDGPPDAIDGQPQPAQEEAPPEDTMPMPGMSIPGGDRSSMPAPPSMMSAVQRYSQAGKGTGEFTHRDLHPNFEGVPVADQTRQEDVEQEQDSSLTWIDQSGIPLKVGHEYEMYTSEYDIPEIVQITAIKPNSIEYVLTGAYGLDHSTEVTKEDANLNQISFRSVEGTDAGIENAGLEENDDNAQDRADPGYEQSDLSTPHMMTSSDSYVDVATGEVKRRGVDRGVAHRDPNLSWLKDSGAQYTQMEQRELIDERGEARNRDKLDLAGTHYQDPLDDDFLW